MTDLDISPNEVVYKCNSCGATDWSHTPATHCDRPDCGSDDIDVIADRITRRAKWMWDDSETIDDMIAQTEAKLDRLRKLKDAGWEVDPDTTPVTDDYAYLVKYREGYDESDLE